MSLEVEEILISTKSPYVRKLYSTVFLLIIVALMALMLFEITMKSAILTLISLFIVYLSAIKYRNCENFVLSEDHLQVAFTDILIHKSNVISIIKMTEVDGRLVHITLQVKPMSVVWVPGMMFGLYNFINLYFEAGDGSPVIERIEEWQRDE